MPFFINSGQGFVCNHCRKVFPSREKWACADFAQWGRDLCERCCSQRGNCRRLRRWKAAEWDIVEKQVAFFDGVWSCCATAATTDEGCAAYDCRQKPVQPA